MWILRSARLLMLIAVCSLLVSLPVLAQDTPALPLTATFTSEDGSFSFEYPSDWVVEAQRGTAVLASSENTLTASQQPPRGEIRVTLYAGPTDALAGLEAGAPLELVLAAATILVSQDANCQPFTVPERLEVNGRLLLRSEQTCGAQESILIVVELDADAVGVIGGTTLTGGLNKFSATLLAIAATLEFAPTAEEPAAEADSAPDLTGTFTSSTGALTFDYPDSWLVEENRDGVIAITDGAISIFPDPIRGQLAAYLVVTVLPESISATLPEILNRMVSSTSDSSLYSDMESFSIGAFRAVRARVTSSTVDSMIVVVDMGDNVYALVDLLHLSGRLNAFEPTVYAILASLEYDIEAAGVPDTQLEEIAAEDIAELDATFISDDESLAFQYPEDWFVIEQVVQGRPYYVISPTEDIENGPTGDAPYLILQQIGLSAIESGGLPSDRAERTLETLNMMRQEPGVEFTEPENFSLNGEIVGRIDIIAEQVDSRAFVRYLSDDRFVVLHAFTPPGELEDLMPTLLAMVDSITSDVDSVSAFSGFDQDSQQAPETDVQPTQVEEPLVEPTPVPVEPLSLDLDETFTSEDGTLILHYPAGWTLDNNASLLTLQNVEELQVESGDSGLEVARGEYRVILGIEPSEGAALEDIFTRETADADVGDPETLTIGDHEAVSAPIDLRVMSGTLYVVDLGGGQVLIVTAIHAPGERATLEPLVSELVKSLELTEPA